MSYEEDRITRLEEKVLRLEKALEKLVQDVAPLYWQNRKIGPGHKMHNPDNIMGVLLARDEQC